MMSQTKDTDIEVITASAHASPEGLLGKEYDGHKSGLDGNGGLKNPDHVDLRRDLKARHISMLAIGAAVGTGLIIGTGEALAKAGPASIFLAYILVGFVVYPVLCGLGEMAAWLALPSGFTGYATRFCDPALGFAIGWTYWMKYIISGPNQLTAGALVVSYWLPASKVNAGVWITVFLVLSVIFNYFAVRFFGEIEFWLSALKCLIILGIILLSFILMLGGGPDHDRKGFRYWQHPGAFNAYIAKGAAGKFFAFWSSLVTALFAFGSTEMIGITVGEARNPKRTIPRAINWTFGQVFVYYALSVFLVGTIVPHNSKKLSFAAGASGTAAASPFVAAIEIAGITVLPHILNACILVFVFTAANSDLYIATRTLYTLARENKAPKIFARTDSRGVPVYSLGIATLFSLLAYMNVSDSSKTVFKYFVNLCTIFGILTWISILVSHICFVRARRAQKIPDSSLNYVSPMGLPGAYLSLVSCIIISLTKNYDVFTHNKKWGDFDYKNFITGYLGIPLYLALIFGYKLATRCKRVEPETADLWTGKEEIDRQEAEYRAHKDTENQVRSQSRYKVAASSVFKKLVPVRG